MFSNKLIKKAENLTQQE